MSAFITIACMAAATAVAFVFMQHHQDSHNPTERLKQALLAHALDTINNSQPQSIIPTAHYFNYPTTPKIADIKTARELFTEYVDRTRTK